MRTDAEHIIHFMTWALWGVFIFSGCALEEVKPPAPTPKLLLSTEHSKRYSSRSQGTFRAVAIEGETIPIRASLTHPSEKVVLNFSYSGEAQPSVDFAPLYQLEIPAGQQHVSGSLLIIENDQYDNIPKHLDIKVELISESAIEFDSQSLKYEILDNEILISVETEYDLDSDLEIFPNQRFRDSIVFNSNLPDGNYQIKLFKAHGLDEFNFESTVDIAYGVRTITNRNSQYKIRNPYSDVVANSHNLYKIEKEEGNISIFRDCHFDKSDLPGEYELIVREGIDFSEVSTYQAEIEKNAKDSLQFELTSNLLGQLTLKGVILEDYVEFENGIGVICGNTLWIDLLFPLGTLYGPVSYYVEIEGTKR